MRSTFGLLMVIAYSIGAGCTADSERATASSDGQESGFGAQVERVRSGHSDRIRLAEHVVTDEDLAQLDGELSGLRELSAERSRISDAGLAPLAGLEGLERLKVRQSRVGDAGLKHLAGLHQLKILNLPHARFTDAGLAELKGLQQLELLRFGSPRVTDQGMAHIRQLAGLRFLHLIDVPITDQGLALLEQMTHLESLYIDGSQVTDEGIERLLKALPGLHFHKDQQHHDKDPRKHGHSH